MIGFYPKLFKKDIDKEYHDENSELHRVDGPAIEHVDRTKYWFQNGKRHRENGPAIEYPNGDKSWWYHSKCIGVSWECYTQKKI